MHEIDFGIAYRHKVKGTVIKVTLNEFRGQIYVHIREYYIDPDNNVASPTQKGYAILAEELDSVIELLQQASGALGDIFKRRDQGELNLDE